MVAEPTLRIVCPAWRHVHPSVLGSTHQWIVSAITVHHGALAYLLGINALRASEAAAVRIEDCRG